MKQLIIITLLSLLFSSTAIAQRIQKNENGLYGLAITQKNGNIRWIVKPVYRSIEYNTYGSYLVQNKLHLWGVISANGSDIIPCEYTDKQSALQKYKFAPSNVSTSQTRNNETSINHYYSEFTLDRDYTTYIKEFVEYKINSWQKKGEFEKTADYKNRVTESTRNAMVIKLTEEACNECLSKATVNKLKMSLGEYDADHETFLIHTELGDVVLPVNISLAPSFKKHWSEMTTNNTYDIVNGKIVLRSATFKLNNKTVAYYNDQSNALYAKANINYNFDPIEISLGVETPERKTTIAENNIQIGKSDIDINIPAAKERKDLTFAVVFANEDYREEAKVEFAKSDGQSVANYFNKTLGLPQSNIHYVENATKNDIIRELDWVKTIASVHKEKIKLLIYYAGHGTPDEQSRTAYLIPIDGVANNLKTLFSLSDFYTELGSVDSQSTIVFLDACFSGSLRNGGMMASARGVAIKAKPETPKSNMIVLSAASGDETAWPYNEKRHGLFTYFFLKKLQSSKGDVTLGQLSTYIKEEVGKHSVIMNSKKQTPTINTSPQLSDGWENLKLK